MERMSSQLRDAVAAYAASIDPVPRALDRNWAAIEQRIAEDRDAGAAAEPAAERAGGMRRWSIAAIAVAAAALVVAGIAQRNVASLHERIDAAGTLAPYASGDSDDPSEPTAVLEVQRDETSAPPREPERVVVPVSSPAAASPAATAEIPSVERPTRRERPRPRSAPAPASRPESTLAAEVALLGRVRAALRDGDAAAALRGLETHARAYPQGALHEAARALKVSALCRAHRREDAERERVAFLRDHGDSPLAATVRGVCVDLGDEER